MKLSIIIPCYNEDNTIKQVLENILMLKFPIEREVIIIDDGSKFIQNKYIKNYIDNKTVRFHRLKNNHGKGFAVRIGLKLASGDIFLIQDADLEYNPKDILKMLKPLLESKAKIIFGTRFYSKAPRMSKLHYFGNIFLTRITNIFFRSKLTDMETGYKLFSKEILEKIQLHSIEFEFEPELTSKVLTLGYKIVEVPVSYQYRKYDKTKITFFDGIESLLVLIQNKLFQKSNSFNFLMRIYKYHIKINLKQLYFKFKRYL